MRRTAAFAAAVGLVACGADRPQVVRSAPSPAVVDAGVDVAAPEASAPDAAARTCWTAGPIVAAADAGAPAPIPIAASSYPLEFPALGAAERSRRAAALEARYPGFEFHLDEVGVVVSLASERMPCEVADAGQLTMGNQDATRRFMVELGAEMPDVPFLAGYGASLYLGPNRTPRLLLAQTRDVPAVLASALPKTELTDAELLQKWAGSRVQWIRPVEHQRVIPMPNPCARNRSGHPCDPPGPRVITTVERRLRGERPMAKRYVGEIDRATVMMRTPTGVEIRRVATLRVDDRALGRDLFGSDAAANLEGEYGVDLVVTGTDRRDAITGAPLPR